MAFTEDREECNVCILKFYIIAHIVKKKKNSKISLLAFNYKNNSKK